MRLVPKLGLGAIALVVLTLGLLAGNTIVRAAQVPTGNVVAIDADPGTAGIQNTLTVAVGSTFTVDHVITASPDAWQAEQTNMSYPLSILGNPVFLGDTNLGSATLCGGGTIGTALGLGSLYNGCARLSGTTTATGVTRTWQLDCIAPGSATLDFFTDADVGVATGTNFALSGGDTGEPDPTNGLLGATINCVLPISKSNDVGGSAPAGSSFNWTVQIDNPTTSPVTGVTVNDPIPAGLTVNSATPSDASTCDLTVQCTGVTIPASGSWTVVINVSVPLSAAGSSFTNTASSDATGTASDTVTVPGTGLSVAKSADVANAQVGNSIVYTVVVSNAAGASAATGVTISDTANDANVTITAASADEGYSCTNTASTVTCSGGNDITDTNPVTVTINADVVDSVNNTCSDTATATSTNGGSASDTLDLQCLSASVLMQKDVSTAEVGDPVPTTDANLFICQDSATCWDPSNPTVNNGYGHLVVLERISNQADTDGLGAFEFQLKYDHKIFDIQICEGYAPGLNPDGSCNQVSSFLYSTGRVPNAAGGVGGCDATIVTENFILFGCVSKNPVDGSGNPIITPGATGNGVLATIHVTPEADLASRLTPGQKNGVVRTLDDENCEAADIYGDPLGTGTFDALGREILLPGVVDGGLVQACEDATITVRMLEGDLNLDCSVDVTDDQMIAFRYGSFFGSLFYDPFFDLEPALKDLDIDIKDLQKVFGRNGSTCAAPIPDQSPGADPTSLP